MSQRKSIVFQVVICLFMTAMVLFTAVLNTSEFAKNYGEASAENNYIVLDSMVERIEYGLRYGRELEHYYGIDSVFEGLARHCGTDAYFVTDAEGTPLYGSPPPDWAKDEAKRLAIEGGEYAQVSGRKETGLLVPIRQGGESVGYAGITFPVDYVDEVTGGYLQRIYRFAILAALVGMAVFLLLFRVLRGQYRKNPDPKRLVRMLLLAVLPVLIAMNVAAMGNTYFVLMDGYRTIASDVSEKLLEKNADDLSALVEQGVNYADIRDTDAYYQRITDRVAQLDSIGLTVEQPPEGTLFRQLPTDAAGERAFLSAAVSEHYIHQCVNSAILNVIASAVTGVMVASEILLFLIGIIVEPPLDRRHRHEVNQKVTQEHIEVVRGISFFFAAFRYMSVAFMAVVLAEIYRPISIFGISIPYEIVMSLPLSAQVFISMITSYLSGRLTERRGWKQVTLIGILVMTMGTLASAFAGEPLSFIAAQMCVGTGLGFAKMGIDIYAVIVASEEDMSLYTASSNASIIVGFSSSALIGALLANIFGYSGAYLAMSVMGAAVFLLVYFFGMDLKSSAHREEEKPQGGGEPTGFDLRFAVYILFMIIPYFFLMMFVDYFFPVYAVKNGVGVDAIGYVMLFYGMATAYVGTTLCKHLSKRFGPAAQMVGTLLVLGVAIVVFTVLGSPIFAALIVLLIGIADGIMPSAQFDYVYHLPMSQRIGFSRALGIEGFFSSLIGAVAPVVFGVVMMKGMGALAMVAALVIAASVVFLVVNGGRKVFRNTPTALIALTLAASLALSGGAEAAQTAQNGAHPARETLRVGYCQAESYYEFDYQLFDIAKGLEEQGDISALPAALHEGSSAAEVWEALTRVESEHYVFQTGDYVDLSAGEYAGMSEKKQAKALRAACRDIDLMITMGTAAGLAVKQNTEVPYMNFLASDPVASGIVAGAEYSGSSRGWAHVNNGVDAKALSVMEDIFRPKRLGIVYNMDDPDAYIYSSAASVDAFAKEKGIEVVKVSVQDDIDDTNEAYNSYLNEMKSAHETLSHSGIDSYILTTSLLEPEDFAQVLHPLVAQGIPVFSVNSTEDVRYGATAAVEMFDYQNIGRFTAQTIERFRMGEGLETLSQRYDTAPFLVLNIDTLQRSGLTLPLDVLLSASTIYRSYEED